jgi:hypothetical protein
MGKRHGREVLTRGMDVWLTEKETERCPADFNKSSQDTAPLGPSCQLESYVFLYIPTQWCEASVGVLRLFVVC